eukprot:4351758-Amphidinium_carterae.1
MPTTRTIHHFHSPHYPPQKITKLQSELAICNEFCDHCHRNGIAQGKDASISASLDKSVALSSGATLKAGLTTALSPGAGEVRAQVREIRIAKTTLLSRENTRNKRTIGTCSEYSN